MIRDRYHGFSRNGRPKRTSAGREMLPVHDQLGCEVAVLVKGDEGSDRAELVRRGRGGYEECDEAEKPDPPCHGSSTETSLVRM